MSQAILHFQCTSCHSSLTVPVHLAGVTGPCPNCGATVTSPQAPVSEPLAVPPMPSMPVHASQVMPPVQEPVATIPQPQSYPPPPPQPEAAPEGWGSPAIPPQMPVADMQPPAHLPPAPQGMPELPVAPTMLPPRRMPGQPPAVGSLMNQQGLGGFGAAGGAAPSPTPQWNLPTTPEPPPMPERPVEDPMTTILMGTGTPMTSELDNDPRRLTPAFPFPPEQTPQPAPVNFPPPMTNIRLGGKKRSGKMVGALAAVLILGALAGAAWYFQEPVLELVKRYLPSETPADNVGATEPQSPTSEPAAPETPATTPTEPEPFDPVAKMPPQQDLTVEKPKPIIVENGPGPSPTPTPPVTPTPSGSSASSILGSTPPQPLPGTEVKPAGTPDVPVTMPAVPKATIVEETPDKPAATEPPKAVAPAAQHIPGTALGKMEKETGSDPLVEVAPGKSVGPDTQSARSATSSSADLTKDVVVQATPESKRAADALKSFLAAKNLSERIPLTLGSDHLKSLMERYYARKDSGSIDVDEIKLLRFDPAPDTGGGPHCVFTVASKLWEHPIPVMLQEEGGAFKVDWLAFVEFRDNLLFEFLSEFQEMPARFHVGIRRTHYFEDDVPDLSEKDCFEIQPPMPTYVGYVFVPKNTPLAKDLANRLSWETLTAYVIVELRWKRLGEMKWVELTAVPQLNWYSYPQVAETEPSPSSKPAPKKGTGGVDVKKLK